MDPFKLDNPKIPLPAEQLSQLHGYLEDSDFALFELPQNLGKVGIRYLSRESGQINVQFQGDGNLFSLNIKGLDTEVSMFHPKHAGIDDQLAFISAVLHSVSFGTRHDDSYATEWFHNNDVTLSYAHLTIIPNVKKILDCPSAGLEDIFKPSVPVRETTAEEFPKIQSLIESFTITIPIETAGTKQSVSRSSEGFDLEGSIYPGRDYTGLTLIVMLWGDNSHVSLKNVHVYLEDMKTGTRIDSDGADDVLMFDGLEPGQTYQLKIAD